MMHNLPIHQIETFWLYTGEYFAFLCPVGHLGFDASIPLQTRYFCPLCARGMHAHSALEFGGHHTLPMIGPLYELQPRGWRWMQGVGDD